MDLIDTDNDCKIPLTRPLPPSFRYYMLNVKEECLYNIMNIKK